MRDKVCIGDVYKNIRNNLKVVVLQVNTSKDEYGKEVKYYHNVKYVYSLNHQDNWPSLLSEITYKLVMRKIT
jgi:hypothetical protein